MIEVKTEFTHADTTLMHLKKGQHQRMTRGCKDYCEEDMLLFDTINIVKKRTHLVTNIIHKQVSTKKKLTQFIAEGNLRSLQALKF